MSRIACLPFISILTLGADAATAAPQVISPVNGHAYQYVPAPGVSWQDARSLAEQMTFLGGSGHLATITSAAENDFVINLITGPARVWLGGFQEPGAPDFSEPGGGWRWVTGEVFNFTNWGAGEPNNNPDPEDYLQALPGGGWNDIRAGQLSPLGGFVVEFDGAACQPDDGFSPNHSCATAHVFSGIPGVTRVVEEPLVISNAEADYFFLDRDTAGSSIYARVDFVHAEGDLDLYLHSAQFCGAPTVPASASTRDFETVSITTTEPVILEVRRNGGPGSCSAYLLTILQQRHNGGLGGTICENSTNSLGVQAGLQVSGSLDVTDNDLTLRVDSLPPSSFGIFVNGRGVGFLAPAGNQGVFCINSGGLGRFSRPGEIQSSGPAPFGTVTFSPDLTDIPRSNGIVAIQPGERWAFQYWYRDLSSAGAPTSNFSTAQMVWFE